MNDENLKPQNTRTKSEQRKIARMGGIASGEARRKKKAWKETLNMILTEVDLSSVMGDKVTAQFKSILGDDFTNDEVILLQQVIQAIKGNRQAAEFVRDTSGNRPVEVLEVSETNSESLREMEEYLYGQTTDTSLT